MSEQARGAVENAKESVADVAGTAKDKATDAVRGQVDERSTQAGEQVASTADDVRAVGDTLREHGNSAAADLAERAAGYVQQLADYLTNSGPDKILNDVQAMARKQPWVVIAGGLVAGFAASRLVRASARRDHSDSNDGGDYPRHAGSYTQPAYDRPGYGQPGYEQPLYDRTVEDRPLYADTAVGQSVGDVPMDPRTRMERSGDDSGEVTRVVGT